MTNIIITSFVISGIACIYSIVAFFRFIHANKLKKEHELELKKAQEEKLTRELDERLEAEILQKDLSDYLNQQMSKGRNPPITRIIEIPGDSWDEGPPPHMEECVHRPYDVEKPELKWEILVEQINDSPNAWIIECLKF